MTNFVVQSKMNNLLGREIVDPDLPDQDLPTRKDPVDLRTLGFEVLDEPKEVAPGITLYARAEEVDPSKIKITFNENAAITTRANTLRTGGGLGLNLTGAGVTVGVWDGGAIRSTHQELNGRVIVVDAVAFSDHATHVAGTIGATGIVAAARGMANQVNIRSRDFNNDITELNSDAGLIELSNHSYGFTTGWLGRLVTAPTLTIPTDFWTENRSDFSQEDPDFGRYSTETQTLDNVLYNNPALLSVWAAGNDRNDQFTGANGNLYLANLNGPVPGTNFIAAPGLYLIDPVASGLAVPPQDGNGGIGYDSLPEVQTAKNSLVVGSISDTTWTAGNTIAMGGIVSSFSNWGPTDDGRMKPDLVANGESLNSSGATNDTDYYLSTGTSMAAPNVTGTMALLYEHHQNLDGLNDPEYENVQNITGIPTQPRFKTIAEPLSSTMKGLAIHTATDIGLTGPDYQSGWGLLNAQNAATFLSDLRNPYQNNRSLLAEDTFVGRPRNIGKVNSSGGEIKVTLVWTDPAPATLPTRGTNDGNIDDSTSVLVNDLDLYLEDSSGNIYRPWTLDPGNPFLGAVKTTANNRDNIEQVVFNATTEGIGAGDYTVYVDGVLDPGFPDQDFSIFFSSVPQFGDGHGWGDVHLVTFDGRKYDFQSVGEFILIESTVDDWQVQTRQEPWKNKTTVSVNTAFATTMDGFKVVYDLDRPDGEKLTIEGTTIQIASGQSQTLSASIIERQDNVYTFTWAGLDGTIGTADDDRITARDQGDHINIYVDPADYRTTFVRGLLGNGNGNVADDFTLRDGTLLSENPTAVEIHTKWADSWRITQEESLFGTKTFSDPNFPKPLLTKDDLDPEVWEKALRTARAAGIPEDFVEEAAFDFAATGEYHFIKSAAETFDDDINCENHPPEAEDDYFMTKENQPIKGNVLADNGNGADSDPDEDTLIIVDNTNPQNGKVKINRRGDFYYFPNPNFSGEDSFEYTISDNNGGTSTAKVNITVKKINPSYTDPYFPGDGLLFRRDTIKGNLSLSEMNDNQIGEISPIINADNENILKLKQDLQITTGNLTGNHQEASIMRNNINGPLDCGKMEYNQIVDINNFFDSATVNHSLVI